MRFTSSTTLCARFREPADRVARTRSPAMLGIGPRLTIEGSSFKIIFEQIADYSVVEKLHSTIGVVDHEPFPCAQQLVGNHQRADRVVACAAAGIADDMGVAFRKVAYFAGSALHPYR